MPVACMCDRHFFVVQMDREDMGLCTWSRRRGLYVIMNLKEGE